MKSFLQGKRSLDIAALKPPHTGIILATDGTKLPETPEIAGLSPQVELVKQGDKIVRIIVTCTCGERTEIDCLYPPGQ